MIDQPSYENFLRRAFPVIFGTAVEMLGDEDEAALIAQRLVLEAYWATSTTRLLA